MQYICDTIELKKAMADKEIKTNLKLSEISRVNRNTVGQVVSGKAQPSAEVMYKFAEALDLTPERAGVIFFKPNLRNK